MQAHADVCLIPINERFVEASTVQFGQVKAQVYMSQAYYSEDFATQRYRSECKSEQLNLFTFLM